MMTPIDYARAACDTLMRKFDAPDLPPKGTFLYHQGVFLSGMYQTWQLCGDDKYIDYIKSWIDSVFDDDGNINQCEYTDVDYIQPGILLFPILDQTGNPYYMRCIEAVREEVRQVPRNGQGGYWHKNRMPNQMWLDGLYMVGPFCAEYAKRFHDPELMADVVWQAQLMEKVTRDEQTGLLFHACDLSKKEKWANPETGCSQEFWGRSMGWVPVALLNDVDFMDMESDGAKELLRIATTLLRNLCKYQSEEGRWYQVVNKGEHPENWLENSCTSLYVAALCKSVRKGYLPKSYMEYAVKGYEAVIRSLEWKGEDIQIGNVCIGTGVGNYDFYIKRPVSVNDLHGVGAFLLMCTEMQMTLSSVY